MDPPQPSPQPDLAHQELEKIISSNVSAIAELRLRANKGSSRTERRLASLATKIGRPAGLYVVIAFAGAWVAANLIVLWSGGRPFDPPPFPGLQTCMAFLALVGTIIILIGQNRQLRIVEHRAELDLQLNILTEQRTARLISLIEELRRDLRDIEPLGGPELAALSLAADPRKLVEVIEESISRADQMAGYNSPLVD